MIPHPPGAHFSNTELLCGDTAPDDKSRGAFSVVIGLCPAEVPATSKPDQVWNEEHRVLAQY